MSWRFPRLSVSVSLRWVRKASLNLAFRFSLGG
jgi:hypothetical protein